MQVHALHASQPSLHVRLVRSNSLTASSASDLNAIATSSPSAPRCYLEPELRPKAAPQGRPTAPSAELRARNVSALDYLPLIRIPSSATTWQWSSTQCAKPWAVTSATAFYTARAILPFEKLASIVQSYKWDPFTSQSHLKTCHWATNDDCRAQLSSATSQTFRLRTWAFRIRRANLGPALLGHMEPPHAWRASHGGCLCILSIYSYSSSRATTFNPSGVGLGG